MSCNTFGAFFGAHLVPFFGLVAVIWSEKCQDIERADLRNKDPMLVVKNKLASLEATLVRNYDPAGHLLTGVRCRATSVAKKLMVPGSKSICPPKSVLGNK